MVWYSHLFQNFPQFIMIHTVKGFGTVNKAEIDVFLKSHSNTLSQKETTNLQKPNLSHRIFDLKNIKLKITIMGTFLVVQWLEICLPVQRVWIGSLFGKLRCHTPCMGQLSLHATSGEATHSRAHTSQQEKTVS